MLVDASPRIGREFVDPANVPLLKECAALCYEPASQSYHPGGSWSAATTQASFASLMIGAGDADGSVGGACTKDTWKWEND